MKAKYLVALAVASVLTVGLAPLASNFRPAQANPCASVNPCAGANPCAGVDPCASANPCAGVDPCAGANPCAGVDPCAGVNPCAGVDPCAGANPCAGVDPCAGANPCAGIDPCAGANPCAGVDPCAGANPCAGAGSETTGATAPEVYTAPNGLAIRGADPVAYFTEGAAVIGSSEYQYEWQGSTWQFASAQNRDMFASNPEQYAPQYGGYCAKAMTEGNLVSVDPEAWRIVDGQLYLNYSMDVQQIWLQDVPGNIALADANWPDALVGNTVFE